MNENLELTLDEVEYIVAFIRNHEWHEIPLTIKESILPKLEEYINESY